MTYTLQRPAANTLSVKRRIAANPDARAVAVHLTVQALGVIVLALFTGWHDLDLLGRFTAWDGQWYLQIAENGYEGVTGLSPSFENASLAFFPLYPMLISLVALLPGVGHIAAGLMISVAAGSIAACGLVRLARHVDPRPTVGLLLVALWAAAPMAITLSMVYTEALFSALAIWALVGVLERNWWVAAACCFYAGTVRSTAGALIAVVVVAALIAAWRESGRARWHAVSCAVVSPLGLLGYWGYVATETGSLTGWADIEQRGWDMNFDFGAETAAWFVATLATGSSVMMLGAAVLLIAAAVLVGVCLYQRVPWPLTAYGALVLALVIGTGGLEMTKPRLLLVGSWALLIPVAVGLTNRQRPAMLGGAVALAALGVWFSAYSLTAWQYAI